MRDRHTVVTRYVTRDVTRESQHPVPTRPGPTRPALYKERGETSIHSVTYVTRATATRWMEQAR